MKHSVLKTMSAFIVASMTGCASTQYLYVPLQNQVDATGTSGRRNEAFYPIPLKNPSGGVRILSLGIVDFKSEGNSKALPSTHIRMLISNQSGDQIWTLHSQDQYVSFSNQGQSHPALVNSNATNSPLLEIQPRDLKTIDLYFPLPNANESASDISEFDFHWNIQVGELRIQETTPFDRVIRRETACAAYPYYYPPYPFILGWGPSGWGRF